MVLFYLLDHDKQALGQFAAKCEADGAIVGVSECEAMVVYQKAVGR